MGWSHRRAGLGAVLALVLGAGCVSPLSEMRADAQPVQTEVGTVRLEYPPSEARGAAMVRASIEKAGPRLAKWGKLQQPVTVRIHRDHKTLEEAARHSGYEWLRAWTRYDVLDMQAPDTWSPVPATQQDLDETMLHELTHAVMYQAAADLGGWRQKKIPAWFREGMATYTAEQGYRWPTLEQLARTMDEHPKWEPLLRPEALYQDEMPVAYGAAHHAFTFLVNRYGEGTVRALLEQMRQGPDFPTAFTKTVGITPEAFLRDFERYLRLRGFRGGRLLHPAELAPAEPLPESPTPQKP
ncbi:MAG: peptidase MA family metallohydrolase [Hyalangium sp.]|uniref:peptidase MA family metallohydrolase n=1 Tax=Hyalangium sp. TaxID=2028555 RepID=UPI00389AD915